MHESINVIKFQMQEKNVGSQDEVRALLLLDKAPVQCEDNLHSNDGKFKCLFIPLNTSAIIQPIDQGVNPKLLMFTQKKTASRFLVFFFLKINQNTST